MRPLTPGEPWLRKQPPFLRNRRSRPDYPCRYMLVAGVVGEGDSGKELVPTLRGHRERLADVSASVWRVGLNPINLCRRSTVEFVKWQRHADLRHWPKRQKLGWNSAQDNDTPNMVVRGLAVC